MRTEPARHFYRMSPFSKAAGLAILLLFCAPAVSADPSAPTKVLASYKVLFNGFDIGEFKFESSVESATYSLWSNGRAPRTARAS
mgnify:CR=1 FL=1